MPTVHHTSITKYIICSRSISLHRSQCFLDNKLINKTTLMFASFGNSSKNKGEKHDKGVFGVSFKAENFIPGLVIGFVLGLLLDLTKLTNNNGNNASTSLMPKKRLASNNSDEELKMVLVVRQDLKMGTGKIASQCAHAATGMYAELMQSQRSVLRQWESCGQAKIVVTCKNQQEMNKLKEAAECIGLPTFVVADAGRTQVSSGSKTVLAIGPGSKSVIDSVTGKQNLL